MSKPSRPASGFVPIGELAGTLPGIVPRAVMSSASWMICRPAPPTTSWGIRTSS